MSDIAGKTLVTSQGTVRAGQTIPKLPKDEMDDIRKAGGIARLPTAKPDDEARVTAYTDAVTELKAAEADVSKAKTDEEKKLSNERLTEARRVLFSM